MQTSSYASGFLYSLKTHQILLLKSQPKDSTDSLWSTLSGECTEGEEAGVAFARIVNKLLNVNLRPKDIHPIYDYFNVEKDKNNYVFYAEVKNSKEFDCPFSWVGFGETSKLPFAPHSKQDVIVGERVIHAKWREDEAKNTGSNLGG